MMKKLAKLLFSILGRLRQGPYVGAAGVIVKDNKILLVKECLGYSLPGGLVDYGEDPQDAVIREVNEETGLSVYVRKRIDVYTSPSRDPVAHSILFLYECQVLGGELKKSFEGTPEWVPIDKIPKDMKHGYHRILKDYFSNRK